MRVPSPMTLAALILAGVMPLALRADYLKNADLQEGLAGWHGDGEAAFLNPDGTEGSEGDPGVIPVIKLKLSRGTAHSVYQEFETRDKPASLHVTVDFFASSDLKRSKSKDDYTPELIDLGPDTYFEWDLPAVCNVDFWVRVGPEGHIKLAQAAVGKWVTVDYKFTNTVDQDGRSVFFCVPPGEGTIYIRNPSVTP